MMTIIHFHAFCKYITICGPKYVHLYILGYLNLPSTTIKKAYLPFYFRISSDHNKIRSDLIGSQIGSHRIRYDLNSDPTKKQKKSKMSTIWHFFVSGLGSYRIRSDLIGSQIGITSDPIGSNKNPFGSHRIKNVTFIK
jgi:hypothetical protein